MAMRSAPATLVARKNTLCAHAQIYEKSAAVKQLCALRGKEGSESRRDRPMYTRFPIHRRQ